MHSVLVVARAAKLSDPEEHRIAWKELLEFVSAQSWPNSAVTVLSEGCLHILLENGLPYFAAFVNQCSEHQIPYRVLFFEEDPKWIGSVAEDKKEK